jgi:hypothetical protein
MAKTVSGSKILSSALLVWLTIAQPFKAGLPTHGRQKSRQGRQEFSFVPSGTLTKDAINPSDESLGYSQNHLAAIFTWRRFNFHLRQRV